MSNATDKNLKVSFCTTCMGRLHHLKETLPKNLANNSDHPNTEFVILAYGDREVYDWVKSEYPKDIESGKIVLAFSEQEYFRLSHAKNMAHRLGTGDILVNLDADNVTGKGFASWLNREFLRDREIVVRTRPEQNRIRSVKGIITKSTGGRIAISEDNFSKLHGYDEELYNGYLGDDDDFKDRAKAFGLKHKDPLQYLGTAIQHGDDKRLDNLDEAERAKSEKHLAKMNQPVSIVKRIERKAKKIFLKDIINSNGVKNINIKGANPEGNFGCGDVTVMQPDGSERKFDLGAKPHEEWAASYDNIVVQSNTSLAR